MKTTRTPWFGVALALLGGALVSADTLEALDGDFEEPILSIEKGEKGLVVKTGQREVALDRVKTLEFRRVRSKGGTSRLVLSNRDFLRGVVEAGDEDAVGYTSPSLGARKISLELVRALVPGGQSETKERALLDKLNDKSDADWVLMSNGTTVVRGSVVQLDAGKVRVNTDVQDGDQMGKLNFDLDKISLISIAPLGDPPKEPEGIVGVVQLADGSQLRGELVGMDAKTVTILHILAGGKELAIPREQVAKIALQGGRFAYLSDLEPAGVEQRFPPEFTFEVDVWGYKRDRSVAGSPLRLGGKAFAKGLGVHNYCKLTYRIDKRYKSFKATVGLDDSVKYLGEPGFGGTVFRVLVDGKPAKEYPDGIAIKKGRPAQTIEVDVSDKATITLIADFDPVSLHVLGRANWADAHLVR